MLSFNKALGKGKHCLVLASSHCLHSQKAASVKPCNLGTQEMDLGMRADCSLKTSIYCSDQNKQQNPLASLKRILEIKYKTQPTQSHGPVTRPKTKGMI